MTWVNILGIILFLTPIIAGLIFLAIDDWKSLVISLAIVGLMLFGLFLAGADL